MTKPLGYFASDRIFDDLQEQYGAQFQQMPRQSKLAFRAALAIYLCQVEMWKNSSFYTNDDLIDSCIESAYKDLWEQDEKCCLFIQRCQHLKTTDIEALIEAMTAQLKYVGQ